MTSYGGDVAGGATLIPPILANTTAGVTSKGTSSMVVRPR